MARSKSQLGSLVLFIAALAFAGAVFVWFFSRLPADLSIDWPGLWDELHDVLPYRGRYLRIPPWSALLVLPLALLPVNAAWGLLNYLTLIVLIASVPRIPSRRGYWLSVLALVVSFPSLRHMVDGNFEALIIAGVLLVIAGYNRQSPPLLAAGILLAVSKPQETVLLMAALGLYLLRTAPRRLLLHTGLWMLPVMVPTLLWKGEAWINAVFVIQERGSLMDIGLQATLPRIGVDLAPLVWGGVLLVVLVSLGTAYAADHRFSREKAGMLVAASLLIAPYAAGNSLLSVLAIGIIPLAQRRALPGSVLILLLDLPFFFNTRRFIDVQATYHTMTLVLVWLVLVGWVWRTDVFALPLRRVPPEPAT